MKHGSCLVIAALVEYFRRNKASLMVIPWSWASSFRPGAAGIESSCGVSVGESSMGPGSSRCGAVCAAQRRRGVCSGAEVIIREEQRHGRAGQSSRSRWHRQDQSKLVRCRIPLLRHRCGLGLSIAILVTAELSPSLLIAVRAATNSTPIRRLCDQILQDEIEHIYFSASASRSCAVLARFLIRLVHVWHWVFMAGTCVVVWPTSPASAARGICFLSFAGCFPGAGRIDWHYEPGTIDGRRDGERTTCQTRSERMRMLMSLSRVLMKPN